MGILEQILETNKLLSEQIIDLQREIVSLKSAMNSSAKSKSDDEIVLKFKGNDKMNVSMTAKALGIKQTELFEAMEKGKIHSIADTKRIFLAHEVIQFKNNGHTMPRAKKTRPRKKPKLKSTTNINTEISFDNLQKLIAKQKIRTNEKQNRYLG